MKQRGRKEPYHLNLPINQCRGMVLSLILGMGNLPIPEIEIDIQSHKIWYNILMDKISLYKKM